MEKKSLHVKTERLLIREAEEQDIETVIQLKSHPENRDYLWIGTYEEHLAEISNPCHLLLMFEEKETGRIIGYALIRLDFKSDVFELRRIAISDKGRGFGKESMKALIAWAFEEIGTNRFWLDVYPEISSESGFTNLSECTGTVCCAKITEQREGIWIRLSTRYCGKSISAGNEFKRGKGAAVGSREKLSLFVSSNC